MGIAVLQDSPTNSHLTNTLVKLNQKSSCPQSSTKRLSPKKRLLRRLHLRLLLKLRPRRKKQKKWPKNKSSKMRNSASSSQIQNIVVFLSSVQQNLRSSTEERNNGRKPIKINSYSPKKPIVIMTPTTPSRSADSEDNPTSNFGKQ